MSAHSSRGRPRIFVSAIPDSRLLRFGQEVSVLEIYRPVYTFASRNRGPVLCQEIPSNVQPKDKPTRGINPC